MSNLHFFQSYVNLNLEEFNYLDFIEEYKQTNNLKDLDDEQKQLLIQEHPYLKQYFIRPYMNNAKFRNYYLQQQTLNFKLIENLAPYLRGKMLRPQELCYDNPNWYVAIDNITSTAYICYKKLVMIDIDLYKQDKLKTTDDIVNFFVDYTKDKPHLKFWLYKSQGGVHGFLVSEEGKYQDEKYIQMMLDFDCDFFYIVFSYLRGWSVRLNKKQKEQDDNIYQFIDKIGDGEEIEELCNMVKLHINLIPTFVNLPNSKMFAG